jgi:hypothetical protein
MGLMDAPEYDPEPARRRTRRIVIAAVSLIAIVALYFFFRYWPEEHAVNNFFEAIEQKNFEKAYGIYNADPAWKDHPQQFTYTYNQFYLDWGPSGEYGIIGAHHIDCSTEPRKSGFQPATGIIVVVTVNKNPVTRIMWVEKKNKELHISPMYAECGRSG